MEQRRIIILGATGSIGQQALSCIENNELVGFSYYNNEKIANEIKDNFKNAISVSLKNSNKISLVKEMIIETKPTMILNAISGWDGLELSKLILEQGIDLALANKESLVIAGKFLFEIAKANNANIFPVDSEHSSLYELMKIDQENIKSVFITASGGRYFHSSKEEKANIKFNEAIKHPNWDMGERISLDSATLINKFYELVEVIHFFGNKYNIIPIRHKESFVHSFIMFKNNSYLFNVSKPDMKIAIDLALNKFKRNNNVIDEIDFSNLSLNFESIDENKHLPIKWFNEFKETLNYSIGPIVNITNEFCFDLYKKDKINFNDILIIINNELDKFKSFKINKWEDINHLKKEILDDLESRYR